MHWKRAIAAWVLAGLFLSCGRNDERAWRAEGEAVTRSFVELLKSAHSRRELRRLEPEIQAYYVAYAELIVELKGGRPVEGESLDLSGPWGEQLRTELARIYELEGGRELMENCQQEALRYLAKHLVVDS